jgi:hypothetical protein
LTLDEDAIVNLLEGYDKEAKALRQEAMRFCWHMRGGLTYKEAMELCRQEREIIAELIKENIETTKKTGLPYF